MRLLLSDTVRCYYYAFHNNQIINNEFNLLACYPENCPVPVRLQLVP